MKKIKIKISTIIMAIGIAMFCWFTLGVTPTAKAGTEICGVFNGVDACVSPAVNCLCAIIIRPKPQ